MSGRGPRDVWVLTLGAILAAAVLELLQTGGLLGRETGAHDSLFAFGVAATAFAVAEILVVHVRFNRETYTFSLSEIPLVVGLFLLPPDTLVHARLLGGVAALLLHRRQQLRKMAFNAALFAVETEMATVAWHLLVQGRNPMGPLGWAAVGMVVLVCGVLGASLVSLAMRLESGVWPARPVPGLLIDLLNAVFALVVVYVVQADWRAGWVVGVLVAVLVLAYRSYTRLREHSERLESLNSFIRAMGEQQDVSAIAGVVLTHVNDALGGELAALVLDERFEAQMAGRWSLMRGDPAPIRVHPADPFLSWVCDSVGEGLLLRRGGRDGRTLRPAGSTTVKDLMAVPLRCEGRTVGALAVVDRMGDAGTFSDDDLSELATLASHASVALENARLAGLLRRQAAEQEHQALHDELTGLPNRRLFRHELSLALSRSGPLAVLLLDLDRFKEINDTLGHQVGDEMLCVAAARLRGSAPAGAVVARFGGDEFGVLLSGFDEASAVRAAQWIRHSLARPYELSGLTFAVVLAGLRAPASSLTLEITETSLMEDPERAIVALRQLRGLGVSLSVDDLGTGYSSLSYLSKLPVNEVKIDRSFLTQLPRDPDARAIVGAIVELGHRLGRRVVAEGVEDEATWDHLREIGCDAAQGYWMSRPIAGERVSDWLADWDAEHDIRRAGALRVVT